VLVFERGGLQSREQSEVVRLDGLQNESHSHVTLQLVSLLYPGIMLSTMRLTFRKWWPVKPTVMTTNTLLSN